MGLSLLRLYPWVRDGDTWRRYGLLVDEEGDAGEVRLMAAVRLFPGRGASWRVELPNRAAYGGAATKTRAIHRVSQEIDLCCLASVVRYTSAHDRAICQALAASIAEVLEDGGFIPMGAAKRWAPPPARPRPVPPRRWRRAVRAVRLALAGRYYSPRSPRIANLAIQTAKELLCD